MRFLTNCICKAAMGFLVKFYNINCNWEVTMEFLVNPNCFWEVTMVFLANMNLTNCIWEGVVMLLRF